MADQAGALIIISGCDGGQHVQVLLKGKAKRPVMLDHKFTQHVQDLLDAERASRLQHVQHAISGMRNRLNADGVLFSSNAALAFLKIIADELAARSNLILMTIMRVHSTLGAPLTDTLAHDLKQEANKQLNNDVMMLAPLLDDALKQQSPDGQKRMRQILDGDIKKAVKKLEAELDLYTTGLETRARVPAQSATGAVHIIADTIGAVQTAPGAIANVIQQIQPADKQRLIEALERVLHDVNGAADVLPDAKREIEVMAQETRTELASDKPVLAKVRGMLSGIGATIQTLGSMRSAYDLLKTAAAAAGVNLP